MGSGIDITSRKGWSSCQYNDWTMWDDRREMLQKRLNRWLKNQRSKNRWILWETGLDDDEHFVAFDSPEDMLKCHPVGNEQRDDVPRYFNINARPAVINESNGWDEKTFPKAPVNKGFCQRIHMFMKPENSVLAGNEGWKEGQKFQTYTEEYYPEYQYTKSSYISAEPTTLTTKFGTFKINQEKYWDNNCICDLCNHKAGSHYICEAAGFHKGQYLDNDSNPMASWQLHNRREYSYSLTSVK